jgi:hypothetical protein
MSDDVDFAALYRELGVDPDAGASALRNAYRRRVGEIHPDRATGGDPEGLQRLNGQFAAAIRFEREYGRLPGASALRPRPPAAAAATPPNRGSPAVRSHRPVYLLAMLAVLAAVALSHRDETASTTVWPDDEAGLDSAPDAAAMPAAETLPVPPAPERRATFGLGASVEQVIAIQGAPVAVDGNRWLYGPSWIRFACLEVSDWHSSPLYALHTEGAQPAALARRHYRPLHREHCGKTARP